MSYDFKIVEREFTNKDGEKIKYAVALLKIDGVEIVLQPKPEDKNLFRHLVKKLAK